MPNSNTNNILLVPRLRTTNLLHAYTNTGEGLLHMVIKNNWLQCHTIHVFQKEGKK